MSGLTISSTLDSGFQIKSNDSAVPTLYNLATLLFEKSIKATDPVLERLPPILRDRVSVHTAKVREGLNQLGPDVHDENLEVLVTNNRLTEAVFFNFTRPKKIARQLTDKGMLHLKQCPCLRRISSDSMDPEHLSFVRGSSFKEIAESNPFIEVLDLKGFGSLEEGNVVPMLQCLPNLKTFALTSEEATTDAMLAVLCQHQSVNDLTLYNCPNVTDEGMKHLAELSSLRELVFSEAVEVSPEAFAYFLEKTSAEFLILGDIKVKDEMFTSLPEGFQSKLTYLSLNSCKKLTQKSLDKLVEHFPNLNELVLANCTPALKELVVAYQAAGKFPEAIKIKV